MNKKAINSFRKNILAWYDKNRRVLPWRALPGRRMEPYYVWLSEIMLQQTVVAAVIPYFIKFVQRWPTVQDLAAASNDEVMEAWAGLGYYARARNLHKCAKVIAEECDGVFPSDRSELQELPGIGDYTSAAIKAIAFDKPATVVDGNVERVVARWFGIKEPLPDSKKIVRARAEDLSEGRDDRPGDFAQAMMDLGATVCIAGTPRCGLCPVRKGCKAYDLEMTEELPRRRSKGVKPHKFGYVYWVSNDKGQILFEKRPHKGLLGGMNGLPTSDWIEKAAKEKPQHPVILKELKKSAAGRDLKVFHSFTHFDLELVGIRLSASEDIVSGWNGLFWVDNRNVKDMALPTLFKKFVKIIEGS